LKEHVREKYRAIDGLFQAVMVISGHFYGNVLLARENNERDINCFHFWVYPKRLVYIGRRFGTLNTAKV
jgi:hypothetical protein